MKTTKNNKRKTVKLTVNGVQKTPYGTYRVRKTVNGTYYSATFKTRRDAVTYLDMLIGM